MLIMTREVVQSRGLNGYLHNEGFRSDFRSMKDVDDGSAFKFQTQRMMLTVIGKIVQKKRASAEGLKTKDHHSAAVSCHHVCTNTLEV